jgi:hypothetical protein
MQEILDKWLWDGSNEVRKNHDSSRNERSEEDGGEEAEAGLSSPRPEPEPKLKADMILDTDTDAYRAKTGLESDNNMVSELTELSEISPPLIVIIAKLRKVLKKSGSSGSCKKSSS